MAAAAGHSALPEVWGVRILVEHWAIIGVNVFVLISGWFGIRTSLKGACKLLFQVFFIGLLTFGDGIAA